jgi:uncharacterized membrane protein YeaQ/YmgE (transglycosylase-associated protein family)
MFHLIGFIVFGFIVGLIARALMPGRDHMGLLMTSILGISGSLLAGWLGRVLGWYGPEDSAGFIMSTVGAVAVIAIYHFAMRSRAVPAVQSKRDFPRRVA